MGSCSPASVTLSTPSATDVTVVTETIPAGRALPIPQEGMPLTLSIHVGGWGGLPGVNCPAAVSMRVGTIRWESV